MADRHLIDVHILSVREQVAGISLPRSGPSQASSSRGGAVLTRPGGYPCVLECTDVPVDVRLLSRTGIAS
jgi:hypothetical protein